MKTSRFVICILLCAFSLLPNTTFAAVPPDARAMQNTLARVAEKAFPAVVVVLTYQYNGRTYIYSGNGSGFIVREDGVIVTNYHVIKGCDAVAIKLENKQTYLAKLVGVSKEVDLAVLKIEAERRLPVLKFADTGKVKVGHYTIAIGAPFSLAHTMTTGIVSHKGRELGFNYREDYIQTDAAINPGNSGGPLLNIDGEVIGVNDCKINEPGSSGINFAIDGNLAKKIVARLLNSGSTARPSLGLTMENTRGGGVVVTEVIKGSPAEKAGFKVGDVILRVDKRNITNVLDIQSVILSCYEPGDTAEFILTRDRKPYSTKVKFTKAK